MNQPNNYYFNDYFDIFNRQYNYEKEILKTDIYEKDNIYILEMDLPGIKKENIRIYYENGYLTIIATKNSPSDSQNKYLRRERIYGEFKRSFYIGFKKETNIKAFFKEGTLTISFPKKDIEKKPLKNISIS